MTTPPPTDPTRKEPEMPMSNSESRKRDEGVRDGLAEVIAATLAEHGGHVGSSGIPGGAQWWADCLAVDCQWANRGLGGLSAGINAHRAHVASHVAERVRAHLAPIGAMADEWESDLNTPRRMEVARAIHRFDCDWTDECAGANFNDYRLADQVIGLLAAREVAAYQRGRADVLREAADEWRDYQGPPIYRDEVASDLGRRADREASA